MKQQRSGNWRHKGGMGREKKEWDVRWMLGNEEKMWGIEGRGLSLLELCLDELLSYDSSLALSEVLPASVPAGVD